MKKLLGVVSSVECGRAKRRRHCLADAVLAPRSKSHGIGGDGPDSRIWPFDSLELQRGFRGNSDVPRYVRGRREILPRGVTMGGSAGKPALRLR